jgi:hypothetical protein
MDKAAWIDAFVMTMSRLGSTASPELLVDMATALHLSHASSDPVKVARWRVAEFGLPEG